MSDWFKDVGDMHAKYGFDAWRDGQADRLTSQTYDPDAKIDTRALLKKHLAFRVSMMQEELNETLSAAFVQEDPEEVVDGIVDLIVFAIGTLHMFGVDGQKAWDAIHEANMNKKAGVKPGRPNKFGMPDLMKPEGWKPPSHEGNHGILPLIFR